jgi:hypothetical protein
MTSNVNEIRPNVRPRLVKQQDGMQNIELYSEFTLEEWEEEIAYAKEYGASAISAIDTVRSIIGVDIERGKALLPTYGGYSGSPIRPIGLAAVATVSQAVNIPVCGIGGIGNYHHVIEYIMLGASSVQLCTSIILNGFSYIGKIMHDLEEWMTARGYKDFEQIRGMALSSLKSFEEIKVEPYVIQAPVKCNNNSCNMCSSSYSMMILRRKGCLQ